MPEEQQGNQQAGSAGGGNILKRGLRGIGLTGFRFTGKDASTFPTYETLREKIGFKELLALHIAIKDAQEKYKLLEKYHEDARKLYADLGIFTSEEAFSKEKKSLEKGTRTKRKHAYLQIGNVKNMGGVRLAIKDSLTPAFGTHVGNFNVPASVGVTYRSGHSYGVSYVGTENKAYWVGEKENLARICENIREALKQASPEHQTQIEEHIKRLEGKVGGLMDSINTQLQKHESDRLATLKDEEGAGNKRALLKQIDDKIRSDVLIPSSRIYYPHSYKIINNISGMSDVDKRELRTALGAQNLPEEEVGVDENGWPLEVSNGSITFNGSTLQEGVVLLDVFEGRAPRRVPSKFITPCETIDTISWLLSQYDAYISDLRDGRYHPNSITAMDWIMSELSIPDLNHRSWQGSPSKGAQAKIVMKLNPSGEASMDMKPTHLNPAFDLRGKGSTPVHRGRKLYYDSQDNCEPSPDYMISSRGAALYIVHRCIEEAKYFEPSTEQGVGAQELIAAIGNEVGGLDLGPNLEETGITFWKNPFKRQ